MTDWQDHAHRGAPTRPTVQLDEWRNANPARWRLDLDPDPLTVEPEPVAPPLARPVPVRWAWFGLGVCVGVIVAFLVIAFAISPAPRSGTIPTIDPSPVVRPTGGATDPSLAMLDTSGSPLSGAPHEREGGPAPGSASPMDRHDGGAP